MTFLEPYAQLATADNYDVLLGSAAHAAPTIDSGVAPIRSLHCEMGTDDELMAMLDTTGTESPPTFADVCDQLQRLSDDVLHQPVWLGLPDRAVEPQRLTIDS